MAVEARQKVRETEAKVVVGLVSRMARETTIRAAEKARSFTKTSLAGEALQGGRARGEPETIDCGSYT